MRTTAHFSKHPPRSPTHHHRIPENVSQVGSGYAPAPATPTAPCTRSRPDKSKINFETALECHPRPPPTRTRPRSGKMDEIPLLAGKSSIHEAVAAPDTRNTLTCCTIGHSYSACAQASGRPRWTAAGGRRSGGSPNAKVRQFITGGTTAPNPSSGPRPPTSYSRKQTVRPFQTRGTSRTNAHFGHRRIPNELFARTDILGHDLRLIYQVEQHLSRRPRPLRR